MLSTPKHRNIKLVFNDITSSSHSSSHLKNLPHDPKLVYIQFILQHIHIYSSGQARNQNTYLNNSNFITQIINSSFTYNNSKCWHNNTQNYKRPNVTSSSHHFNPLRTSSSSSSSSSTECSAQGQILHCKYRNLGCSFAKGRSSTANSGIKAAVLQGLNRCGSFPLLSAPHSLFST